MPGEPGDQELRPGARRGAGLGLCSWASCQGCWWLNSHLLPCLPGGMGGCGGRSHLPSTEGQGLKETLGFSPQSGGGTGPQLEKAPSGLSGS